MKRRGFLAYAVGMLAAIPSLAQKGIMEKGQAVVCDGNSLTCPLGHKTCPSINAPIVVGNGSRDYPDTAQLYDEKVHRCDVCGVLFIP